MIKPIDKTHWEDLYARLHDAYTECLVEAYDFNKALYDNLKKIKSIIEAHK